MALVAGAPEVEVAAGLLPREKPPDVAAGAGCKEADDAGKLGLAKLNDEGAEEVGAEETLPNRFDPDDWFLAGAPEVGPLAWLFDAPSAFPC